MAPQIHITCVPAFSLPALLLLIHLKSLSTLTLTKTLLLVVIVVQARNRSIAPCNPISSLSRKKGQWINGCEFFSDFNIYKMRVHHLAPRSRCTAFFLDDTMRNLRSVWRPLNDYSVFAILSKRSRLIYCFIEFSYCKVYHYFPPRSDQSSRLNIFPKGKNPPIVTKKNKPSIRKEIKLRKEINILINIQMLLNYCI